jgi:hypothetical protein
LLDNLFQPRSLRASVFPAEYHECHANGDQELNAMRPRARRYLINSASDVVVGTVV